MNDVLQTIKRRRSIRAYKREQIKQEELDRIIEAGMYAPSGHNTQPWYFTVIQDRKIIDLINVEAKKFMVSLDNEWIKNAGKNPEYDITYKAPTLIVISGKKDAITYKIDCCAATQNMLIAAESLNIGSIWLGFVLFGLKDEVNKKICIPEGYEPLYSIALGYKAMDTQPEAPKRNLDPVNYIR